MEDKQLLGNVLYDGKKRVDVHLLKITHIHTHIHTYR